MVEYYFTPGDYESGLAFTVTSANDPIRGDNEKPITIDEALLCDDPDYNEILELAGSRSRHSIDKPLVERVKARLDAAICLTSVNQYREAAYIADDCIDLLLHSGQETVLESIALRQQARAISARGYIEIAKEMSPEHNGNKRHGLAEAALETIQDMKTQYFGNPKIRDLIKYDVSLCDAIICELEADAYFLLGENDKAHRFYKKAAQLAGPLMFQGTPFMNKVGLLVSSPTEFVRETYSNEQGNVVRVNFGQ